MLLYYITSKENAESIKRNGFSSEYICDIIGCKKWLYFTNNYNIAKKHASSNNKIILQFKIDDINLLKLTKVNYFNKSNIQNIKGIVMYIFFNSNKNCITNINENEFIFFRKFNYKLQIC